MCQNTQCRQVLVMSISAPEGPQIDSREEWRRQASNRAPDNKILGSCKYHVLTKKLQISLTNWKFVIQHHWELNPQSLYHRTVGGITVVPLYCMLDTCSEILLFIESTDYRSSFAKTILFENCSCFSKIPFSMSVECPRIFQCLISIPAGHWVRQIDGDLPRRFFLSAILSLVISMTGRSERSARALRDDADVVREAIGN